MPRRSGLGWVAADAAVAAFSFWLASSRRMQFLDATFDDRLFARLADSLRSGEWLGAYDKLTLAKGPGYPAFLALTSAASIPLRLAEQAVYLLGCWLICRMVWRLSDRRWLGSVVFAVAALNPAPWGASLARVVREGYYLGLVVLVLGLAAHTLLARGRPDVTGARLGWGALLGLALGWFWLTREEGVWLAPALGLLALDWVVRRWRTRPRTARLRHAATTLVVLLVPSATFAAVDLGVAAMNWRVYGVFETNEFRSREFKAAYGALSRIQHDRWQRFVPVPRDARERAYANSAAARELEPSLEGDNGNGWKAVGCTSLPIEPCDDIQSGWFMWALRDAVERAQHAKAATDAQRYYARLASEVNAACDHRGAIQCLPSRTGFLPPLRREYMPFVAEDAWKLAGLLARLGGEPPAEPRSENAPAAIRQFQRVASGPWTPPEEARRGPRPNDVHLRGWAFAPSDDVRVRVVNNGSEADADLATYESPDIVTALRAGPGTAIRFGGSVRCGDDPCQIELRWGSRAVRRDLITLASGLAVNEDGARLWLDAVDSLRPASHSWSDPARAMATIISAGLRGASSVLMPVAVALALVLAALDLRRRTLRPLTVLWSALLATMVMRVGLLAVLNATSLPAISPLYLSPAVGVGLLFTVGVLADAANRMFGRP